MTSDTMCSTCCICFVENKKNISVFDTYNTNKYSELIEEYTGLSIPYGGSLPAGLCYECSGELLLVVKFISKCRESSKKLRQAFDTNISYEVLSSGRIKDEVTDSVQEAIESDVKADIKDERCDDSITNTFNDTSEDDIIADFKKEQKSRDKSKKSGYKNGLKCKICRISVQARSAMIVHMRKHTGEKPYRCAYCPKCFSQGGTLVEHTRRLHENHDRFSKRSFTCDICGKQFLKRGDLIIHIRVHTKEKPYQCSKCSLRFSQRSSLNQHYKLHTGERPHACHICDKRFIAMTTLRRHLTVHSDVKNFKCSICNKALKSSFALKKHMIFIHSTQKLQICEICGNSVTNLSSHIKYMHSKGSGQCDKCHKSVSNLAEHMGMHAGAVPFQCNQCGKKFSLKRGLTRHMMGHQNVDKFVCQESDCSKAFSLQSKLNYHVLKYHSKSIPHACQYCPKGFYRISDLTKHVKSVHYKKYDSSMSVSSK